MCMICIYELTLELLFLFLLFSHVLSLFLFFKQTTAYEMRISDWSSDVCSSDLRPRRHLHPVRGAARRPVAAAAVRAGDRLRWLHRLCLLVLARKCVV